MDAIQQLLIDARKKAAKEIVGLYGGPTFGTGTTQYQIMSLNADGSAKADDNGYITVKDLTTQKVSTNFDPLAAGLVTTAPPTTASLTSTHPDLAPNGGGSGGGGFNASSLMGAAGLGVPLVGLFKKGGGSGAGPAAGGPTGPLGAWSYDPKAPLTHGGTAPNGIQIQSPVNSSDLTSWERTLQNNGANPGSRPPLPQPPSLTPPGVPSNLPDQIMPYQQNLQNARDAVTQLQSRMSTIASKITDLGGTIDSSGNVSQTVKLSDPMQREFDQLSSSYQQYSQVAPTYNQAYDKSLQDFNAKAAEINSYYKIDPVIGPNSDVSWESDFSKAAYKVNAWDNQQSLAQQNALAGRNNLAITLNHLDSIQQAYNKDLSAAAKTLLTSEASEAEQIKAYSELTKSGVKPSDLIDSKGAPTEKLLYRVSEDRKSSILDHLPTESELIAVSPTDLQNYLDSHKLVLADSLSFDEVNGYVDAQGNQYSSSQIISRNEAKAGAVLDKRLSENNAKLDKSLSSSQRNQFLGALAGAGVSSWGLFQTIFGMTENGKPTAGGVIGALGSMIGLATSMHYIHTALIDVFKQPTSLFDTLNGLPFLKSLHLGSVFQHMSGTYGTLGIIAAITLFAILMGRKSPESQALEDFNQDVAPSVWSNGPVMMLTAGLGLASMGINLNPNAPMIQQIMVPQIQLNKALQTAAGSMPADGQRYGTAFVQQGTDTQPTTVVYLTPGGMDSHGNMMDVAHVVKLKANMQFTNPGSNGYIPFFVKDSGGKAISNPVAVAAVANQSQLLNASQGVGTKDAQSLTTAAGPTNKGGTTASGAQ